MVYFSRHLNWWFNELNRAADLERRRQGLLHPFGARLLRSRAVESGGQPETPTLARTDAEGFGRESSIRGTPALPVVAREKQRHRRGSRAVVRRGRQVPLHAQGQDHADRDAETGIKRRDDSRETSHRHKHQS